ncbi:hypothetical protein FOA52_009871, partial [Chlamydomonas sp. UWO 241]
ETLSALLLLQLEGIAAAEGASFKKTPHLLEMTMVVLAVALESGIGQSELALRAAQLRDDYRGVIGASRELWSRGPSKSTLTERFDLLAGVIMGGDGVPGRLAPVEPCGALSSGTNATLLERSSPPAAHHAPIADATHAEVDHIVPFMPGGKSVLGNARLVHVLCNRENGSRDAQRECGGRAAAAT